MAFSFLFLWGKFGGGLSVVLTCTSLLFCHRHILTMDEGVPLMSCKACNALLQPPRPRYTSFGLVCACLLNT